MEEVRTSTGFLRLPFKLRVKVYELYLSELDSDKRESRYGPPLQLRIGDQSTETHRHIDFPPIMAVSHKVYDEFWAVMFENATFTCRFFNAGSENMTWNKSHNVTMPLAGSGLDFRPQTTQRGLSRVKNVKLDAVALLQRFDRGPKGSWADTKIVLRKIEAATKIVAMSCRQSHSCDNVTVRTLEIDLRDIFTWSHWAAEAPRDPLDYMSRLALETPLPTIVELAASSAIKCGLRTTICWTKSYGPSIGKDAADWLRGRCGRKGVQVREYSLTFDERDDLRKEPSERRKTVADRDLPTP